MHPLAPNLTEMSDVELQKKHSELVTRLTHAYRYGQTQMVQQLQMIMEDYQSEITRRQQKVLNDMLNKNDKFSGIIDIK
jgi:hypothetical protein